MGLLVAGCQGLIVSLRTKPTLPSRLCVFLLPSLFLSLHGCTSYSWWLQSHSALSRRGVYAVFLSLLVPTQPEYRLQIYTSTSLRCKKKLVLIQYVTAITLGHECCSIKALMS